MAKHDEARDWRDAWVTKLAADPAKNPETVLLTGYIADAPDNQSIRVFLDPQLQQWVDVPVDAILHREEIPRTVSVLGGSHLWLKRASWVNCKRGEVAPDPQAQQYQYWGQTCSQPTPAQK